MAGRFRVDWIRHRAARALALHPLFPLILQMVMLAGLALLVFFGLGVGADTDAATLSTLRKTSLTTLVVWGLWWPAMIAVAMSLGRAWCLVCPMELVNRCADEAARKTGWPRLRMGRLLRAGWLIVLVYMILQWSVAVFHIHRVPHFTALLLVVLLVTALVSGLIFREPRSFCKGFCPAGALLSAYGRLSPVGIDIRDPETCKECDTRDCVQETLRHRFHARSCPSLLRPFAREASDGCVLCLQCAKVCPHDNVGVGVLSTEAPQRREALLRPAEAAFVLMVFGFVSHEVIGELPWLDTWFHAAPSGLARAFPSIGFGWFEAAWFLVLFPACFWLLVLGFVRLFRAGDSLVKTLQVIATGAAPAVAGAHLAKAVAKFVSWGGHLPQAMRDPRGLDTLEGLHAGSITPPGRLLSLEIVGWVLTALLLVLAVRTWSRVRHLEAKDRLAARTGLAFAWAFFTVVLLAWSFA